MHFFSPPHPPSQKKGERLHLSPQISMCDDFSPDFKTESRFFQVCLKSFHARSPRRKENAAALTA